MDPEPKILDNKLFLDGYVYYRRVVIKGRWYWRCHKIGECGATAITYPEGDRVIVAKGPTESPHEHALDREAAEATIVRVGKCCFTVTNCVNIYIYMYIRRQI